MATETVAGGVGGGRPSHERAGVLDTIAGMAKRANPVYATVVPVVILGALVYSVSFATLSQHVYVHVMAGVLWTGIDVFFGLVLGPVIGRLDEAERVAVFSYLTPKLSFLLTPLSITTVFAGITLAIDMGRFPHPMPWLALFTAATLVPSVFLIGYQFDAFHDWRWQCWQGVVTVGSLAWVATTIGDLQGTTLAIEAALVIVTILTVEGFGVIMPGEVRVFLEVTAEDPDTGVISRIGLRNAKLSGVQGFFQVLLVVVMVWLAVGQFPL